MNSENATLAPVMAMKPIGGKSRVVGEKIDLLDKTVGQLLEDTCARYPTHDAVVFPDRHLRWSYVDLKQQVQALAGALLAAGLQPGVVPEPYR